MRPCRQNPARLAELPPENDLVGVALLIQSARQAPDEPLPLVKWRIRNSLRRRSEWNRRGLRLALAGALVFFAGSVVGAIALPLLGSRLRSVPPEPAETHPSAKAVQHSHRRVPVQAIPSAPADQPIVPAKPPAVPAPALLPETRSVAGSDDSATAKVALAPVAPVAAVARASNVLALRPSSTVPGKRALLAAPASLEPMPPVEASPPLPDEHSLLTTAVRRLRTAHDPASALATGGARRLPGALPGRRARSRGGHAARGGAPTDWPQRRCARRVGSAVACSDAQQRRASRSAGRAAGGCGPLARSPGGFRRRPARSRRGEGLYRRANRR